MKHSRKTVLALLLAALLSTAGCDGQHPEPLPDLTEQETYILEWSEADTDREAAVLAAIAAADPNYELLHSYDKIMNGVAVRTTLVGADAAGKVEDVVCVNAGQMAVTEYESNMYSVGNMLSTGKMYDSGYRGEGMTVAVIDASFDPYHELFVLSDENTASFTKDYIDDMVQKGLSSTRYFSEEGGSPYISAKIPYAFDYCGNDTDVRDDKAHGTHVAGSIAANKLGNEESGFDGIAPEAQLILMKVAPDNSGLMDEAALFAALDDALTLGVDAINMSFGVASGYAQMATTSSYFYNLFTYAERKGIDIFCAAGNDGVLGGGSRYDNAYGVDSPLVSNPDYGLISEPASFKDAVAVGSCENEITYVKDYIKTSAGDIILYNESEMNNFASTFSGMTLDYVVLPGLGYDEDYNGLDVRGKIVVIERGILPYSEKAVVAERNGALGMIVYNSEEQSGEEQFIMAMQGETLPSAFVSRDNGLILKDGSSSLTVCSGTLASFATANAGQISDFTSWGPTPELTLKPDLTAPGGNIWSTYPGNSYQSLSGTSMATPTATGAALLLHQYRDGLLDGASIACRKIITADDFITKLMMTSALPIINSNNRNEYSPRAQGAGVVDLEQAMHSAVIMTDESGNRSKVELGDGLTAYFPLTFKVQNFSDRGQDYRLSVSLLSDGYVQNNAGGNFVSGSAVEFSSADIFLTGEKGRSGNLNRNSSAFDGGYLLHLESGEEKTVTVQVNAAGGMLERYKDVFENGFYLEGYIYLTPEEEGVAVASIPYMGFFGDWESVPVFEEIASGGSFFESLIVSYLSRGEEDVQYVLGTNVFGTAGDYEASLVALSPNRDGQGEAIGLLLNPLRNVKSCYVRVYDADGEIAYQSNSLGALKKAYPIGNDLLNTAYLHYVWDCSDIYNQKYILPDGNYTFELVAKTDHVAKTEHTVSFDFYIDTTDPTVEKIVKVRRGNRNYIEVTAADDRALQAAMLYIYEENEAGEAVQSFSALETIPVEDATDRYTFRFDITGHEADEVFYFDLADYAFNIHTVRILTAELD